MPALADGPGWATLLTLYDDRYYSALLGPVAGSAMQNFRHLVTAGLAEGLSPSPLLDPAAYLDNLSQAGLPPPPPGMPALTDWLQRGMAAEIVPTRLFDDEFYRAAYPDLVAGRFAFDHFVSEGLAAGLRPNTWFDPAWYQAATPALEPGQPAFLHFLAIGSQAGLAPNAMVVPARLGATDPDRWARHGAALMTRLDALAQSIGPHATALLLAIYQPSCYERVAPNAGSEPLARLTHFLTDGLASDLPPSPLFEPAFYAKRWLAVSGQNARFEGPAILHWLQHGRAVVPVPTRLFSDAYYRRRYSDMTDAAIDTYDHYVRTGLYEEREPNAWFDPEWRRGRANLTAPGFLGFLLDGAQPGQANRMLALMGGAETTGEPAAGMLDRIEAYASLVAATEPWLALLSAAQLHLAALLFVPEGYGPGDTPMAKLAHYFAHTLGAEDTDGPLFSSQHYRQAAAAAGVTVEGPPMVHFLRTGAELRIVPTPLFDDAFYLRRNPDLQTFPAWRFLHFVEHGLFEGREYGGPPSLSIFSDPEERNATSGRGQLALRTTGDPGALPLGLRAMGRAQRRVTAMLGSAGFAETMARAQRLEPLVGETAAWREILAAPWHDGLRGKLAAVRSRLQRQSYDHIICVPWMRSGGADLVSGWLSHALRELYPGQSILLLCTDQPHFERADWLAERIDVLNMSDLRDRCTQEQAERLLFTVLRALQPRTIFNVNSRLCWEVIRRYGPRMAPAKLFAYLFCWDQTESGLRIGYPSEFFQPTQAHLAGLLTDTRYLKDELVRMYALPDDVSARIVALNTPARALGAMGGDGATMAERGAASAALRPRPLFLWGGRLDFQKRFDLVVEIARRMPDCDFRCWGGAMLDLPPDLSALPSNITMMGRFTQLTDLPLGESDGWLFTSAWEGMPTTIIELGAMGVPIAASAVGGVPELLDAGTGWPVTPFDDVAGFVASLREMARNPAERCLRARALQDRVRRGYTMARYKAALAPLIMPEAG